MRALQLVVAGIAGVIAAGGCGGGGDSNGPGGGSGLTAKVDGQSFSAEPISIVAQAVPGVPGSFLVLGSQTTGGVTTSLTITLYNITGTGTFPLGVSSDVYGGIGLVGQAGESWITDNTGNEGSVTLTTFSATRVAGTFSFTAEPGQGNAVGGTRSVTNGQFDLPLKGTIAPVPANQGGSLTASFGGQPYTAWSLNAFSHDPLGNPGLQLSTSTKDHGLSIVLFNVSAPGTFTLSNTGDGRLISAGHNGGDANHCCWGGGNTGADAGTITVTSLTSSRIKGTFSATLQPTPGKPATTPLVVTGGSFDAGLSP
jgi:hypothetical protein